MARIYLSSTLKDLREERAAVSDWLVAAGHLPVHSYVGDSETVEQSCLEDVAGCDLLVLLLGHRLGHVPALDNPSGASITQLEFRHAGAIGLPRLALMRTAVPDEALSDLGDEVRWKQVNAFRSEVRQSVRAVEFRSLAEMISALSTGVPRLLQRSPMSVGQPAGAAAPEAGRPPPAADGPATVAESAAPMSRGVVPLPRGARPAAPTQAASPSATPNPSLRGKSWMAPGRKATLRGAGVLAVLLGAWIVLSNGDAPPAGAADAGAVDPNGRDSPPAPAITAPGEVSEAVSGATAPAVALPAYRSVGDGVRSVDTPVAATYWLLGMGFDPVVQDRFRLTVHLRMLNRDRYPLNFWSESFRLQRGDALIAPAVGPNLVLNPQVAKDADLQFELPMPGDNDLVLRLIQPGAEQPLAEWTLHRDPPLTWISLRPQRPRAATAASAPD